MRWAWVAISMIACRSSSVTPDHAPLAAPSPDVPAWFGTAGSHRIIGLLVDAEQRPIVGTVHLGIDVPDAAIWKGIDQTTGPDGRFAFVAPRAGRYTLFATAPGLTSRVVDVDARTSDVDVTVFAFACTPQAITITTERGAAIANARVVIGGTLVHSDPQGRVTVCASGQPIEAALHASGYGARTTTFQREQRARSIEMSRAIVIRGRIFDEGGPAAHVGVQPAYVDELRMTHRDIYTVLPLNVTSDANGRFVFHEIAEIGPFSTTPGVLTARSMKGEELVFHNSATFGVHAEGELVLRRERALHETPDTMMKDSLAFTRKKLRGRVVRHGKPVPDAELVRTEIGFPRQTLGFSRSDGTFEVDVLALSHKTHETTVTVTDASGNKIEVDLNSEQDALVELP